MLNFFETLPATGITAKEFNLIFPKLNENHETVYKIQDVKQKEIIKIKEILEEKFEISQVHEEEANDTRTDFDISIEILVNGFLTWHRLATDKIVKKVTFYKFKQHAHDWKFY